MTPNNPEQKTEPINLIEAIRKRPGMFLGDVNIAGSIQLLKEIYEFANTNLKWNSSSIKITTDGFYNIQFDKSTHFEIENGKYKLIEIMTLGKEGLYYEYGLSFLVALSEWIQIKSSDQILIFKKGKFKLEEKLNEPENLNILFKLDSSIMKNTILTEEIIKSFAKKFTYLNNGKSIQVINERTNNLTFFDSKDINDLLLDLSSHAEVIHTPILFKFFDTKSQLNIEAAFAFHNERQRMIYSFVEGRMCLKGGTHITGFLRGFHKAIETIQTKNNLTGRQYINFYNIIAIIKFEYPNINWVGSIKEKISNPELSTLIAKIVKGEIMKYENELIEILDLMGIKKTN